MALINTGACTSSIRPEGKLDCTQNRKAVRGGSQTNDGRCCRPSRLCRRCICRQLPHYMPCCCHALLAAHQTKHDGDATSSRPAERESQRATAESKAREQAGESTQAAARDGEIREGDEVGATITVFEGAKSRFFYQKSFFCTAGGTNRFYAVSGGYDTIRYDTRAGSPHVCVYPALFPHTLSQRFVGPPG